MCLVVVDPRLLVRAFEQPRSCRVAKLLCLFMYGRVCLNVHGVTLEEAEELARTYEGAADQAELLSVRVGAERDQEEAKARKTQLDEAFLEHTPSDMLLVTSSRLLAELRELAAEAGLDLDVVNRQIALCTARTLGWLGPTPFYLGAGRVSEHEYLIQVAAEAMAGHVITEDTDLALAGDLAHVDPRTKEPIRPFTVDDFVSLKLPAHFTLDAIDVPAVFRAGSRTLRLA